MKAVNVGLLGLGTVGGGTLGVLHRNADEISRRAGRAIRVTRAAVRDPARQRPFSTGAIALTADPLEIVNDPNIDIVVELIGGDGIAREAVLRAIDNGKHVVTANKALIALHGNAIFESAQRRGVMVAFEAAVAGGIPVIKSIREGLAANRIEWLAGIINGTSNYILSRMEEAAGDFDEVLREAQALGYAEADPAFDIEGTDAAHKLTILASIAFGIPLQFERVYVQGITAITAEDIAFARELGYRIKHLGIARRTADGIELRVHPTLIPHKRLIANVNGVMNADTGARRCGGSRPCITVPVPAPSRPRLRWWRISWMWCAPLLLTRKNRVPHLAFQPGSLAASPILSIEQSRNCLLFAPAALPTAPACLPPSRASLATAKSALIPILQKGRGRPNENVTIIMLTQQTRELNMNQALKKLAGLDTVSGEIMHIRLEKLILSGGSRLQSTQTRCAALNYARRTSGTETRMADDPKRRRFAAASASAATKSFRKSQHTNFRRTGLFPEPATFARATQGH